MNEGWANGIKGSAYSGASSGVSGVQRAAAFCTLSGTGIRTYGL